MTGMTKNTQWLTVQFFLDDVDGVNEVSVDRDDYSRARCTCTSSNRIRLCRHLAHVRAEVKKTGTYAITVPADLAEDDIDAMMDDADSFRHMLAHSALVIVLPD